MVTASEIPGNKLTPDFVLGDYIKFFGAGALAATATHGVRQVLETRNG